MKTLWLTLLLLGSIFLINADAPVPDIKNGLEEKEKEKKNKTEGIDPKDRKMVACLSLFLVKKNAEEGEWAKIKNVTMTKEQKRKFKAMILEKCSKTISENAISKVKNCIYQFQVVDTEDVESIFAENENYIHIEKSLFESPTFVWAITDTEKLVLDEAKKVFFTY